MVKAGFTMIELIFAIVIIALIVMGVPRIMAENDKHVEGSLVQEGVFAAADVAAKVLSFQWDTNSLDPTEVDAYAKVLDLGGGARDQDPLPLSIGHIQQDLHRRFHSANTQPASAALATVNDVINTQHGDFAIGITSGYSNAEANPHVFGTVNGGARTNMKVATITATATGLNAGTQIVLRVYAANIGEVDYAKRTF